jgi:L-iditol 2-dehydrogenase
MKAVKLYEPGNLKVEEVEVPQINQDGVLLKVKAVGICGSDIPRALVKGAYYEGITLGHEFSGEIVAIGEAVGNWEIGDRVKK